MKRAGSITTLPSFAGPLRMMVTSLLTMRLVVKFVLRVLITVNFWVQREILKMGPVTSAWRRSKHSQRLNMEEMFENS